MRYVFKQQEQIGTGGDFSDPEALPEDAVLDPLADWHRVRRSRPVPAVSRREMPESSVRSGSCSRG